MTPPTYNKFFVVFAVAGLFASAPSFGMGKMRDKRPDAAPAILAAFHAGCSSQGSWTSAAHQETQSIINLIENLKDTAACKPYAAQLVAVQSAATQLQSLQKDSTYSSYMTDQENLTLLTTALQTAKATDPTCTGGTCMAYASALSSLQIQMARDQAAYDIDKQTTKSALIASQSANAMIWAQGLLSMNSSPTLSDCLRQSPAAAVQLAGNLLGYGGSFLSPIYGAGVEVIAQLMNTGVEIFRESKYDRAIFEAQSDEMPDALNCALEAMTEFYCEAEDSYDLLELARQNRNAQHMASSLWRGIDLLSTKVPGLLRWLDKIKNGVPPVDNYQAAKQMDALNQVLSVQKADLSMVASINDAILSYDADHTDQKDQYIINLIVQASLSFVPSTNMGGTPSNSSGQGPLGTFQPDPFAWACWLVKGYVQDVAGTCPQPDPEDKPSSGFSPSTLQMTHFVTTKLGLAPNTGGVYAVTLRLMKNWKSVIEQVENFVNTNFAMNITTNAESLIAEAYTQNVGTPNAMSPHDVLKSISNFIQSMIDYHYPGNPRLPDLLAMKKKTIDEAIQILDGSDDELCRQGGLLPPTAPPGRTGPRSSSSVPAAPPVLSPDECNSARLVKLFELFDLKISTQVFNTDIQDLVNIDIQNRFAQNEFPHSVVDDLKSSGVDLALQLQQAGVGDLNPLMTDITGAQGDIETDLRVFRGFFAQAFDAAVAHEAVLLKGEDREGPHRPHGNKLAQLCLLWLLSGNIPGSDWQSGQVWTSSATAAICRDAALYNGNSNADAAGHFTPAFQIGSLEKEISGQAFSPERVCRYHEYKTKNEADSILPYLDTHTLHSQAQ